MGTLFNWFLALIHVASALFLIVFILLHQGRGGGLSDMFGGPVSGGLAGSTVVEKNLDRMTVLCTLIFVFTTLITGLRWS